MVKYNAKDLLEHFVNYIEDNEEKRTKLYEKIDLFLKDYEVS